MSNLYIDIETYSDINLQKQGVYKYVDSDNFRILLIGYKFDNEDIQVIDLTKNKIPQRVLCALKNKKIYKHAYNAQFERVCLYKYFGLQSNDKQELFDDWHCTMVHASMLGLPRSLDACAKYLKIDVEKKKTGLQLINFFSKPDPKKENNSFNEKISVENEDRWNEFIEYCRQDVLIEFLISEKLQQFPIVKREKILYALDQHINDKGIKIDVELVNKAISISEFIIKQKMKELNEITNLDNPNSLIQLRGWLKTQGVNTISMSREVLERILQEHPNLNPKVKHVIKNRIFLSNNSIKKYKMMNKILCTDQCIRGVLQFYGASKTGRWASRFLQIQNLPRSNIDDLEKIRDIIKKESFDRIVTQYENLSTILKDLIRTTIIPRKNHILYVCDYSSIEARILAWYAKENWLLEVFENRTDIYKATAAKMFKVKIDEVDDQMRNKGKIATLALGYQGSIGALKAMGASRMGLDDIQMNNLVKEWRRTNNKIVKFWREVNNTAKKAIKENASIRLGALKFLYFKNFLFIRLPSGRFLSYPNARLEHTSYGQQIVYDGTSCKKNYEKLSTYGGKLVENIVQGTARDIMAESLYRISQMKQYNSSNIIFHVHDEVVFEINKNDNIQDLKKIISNEMTSERKWSKGLKLDVETYISSYYRK